MGVKAQPPRDRVLLEKVGGVCGPLPKTLTLVMTKISDFPLPYLWPDQKFDILFITVAAGTIALNIVCEKLLNC